MNIFAVKLDNLLLCNFEICNLCSKVYGNHELIVWAVNELFTDVSVSQSVFDIETLGMKSTIKTDSSNHEGYNVDPILND
jgi:hypothetical protein